MSYDNRSQFHKMLPEFPSQSVIQSLCVSFSSTAKMNMKFIYSAVYVQYSSKMNSESVFYSESYKDLLISGFLLW